MTDDGWRRKRYYGKRVLIETSDVLTAPDTCDLYPLSAAHLMLLRNLLQYAGRRSTFVSVYEPQTYLAPTNDEWNVLQETVAELENILMSGCCEDLVTALEAIDTTLGLVNANLAALDTTTADIPTALLASGDILEDMQTALECICASERTTIVNVTVSPTWDVDYPGATDFLEWGNNAPDTTMPDLAEVAACNLAQAWYQAGLEFMTEVILPVMRFGFDKVIPASAAALAIWTGGVAFPVAIGVYAVAELVQELFELAYDSAESNLFNWLWAHKEDIVCPLYIELLDGGSSKGIWAPIQAGLVAPSEELSAGDKLLINLAMGVIGPLGAETARTENSPWFQSVPVAGYCDDCEEEPTVGSDWVAVPYTGEAKVSEIVHPDESSWKGACTWTDLPEGFTCCGMLFEVSDVSGNCDIKAVHGPNAGCAEPDSYVPDNSNLLSEGWYYYRDNWNHTHDEVVAELHPGATQVSLWSNPSGDTTSLAWLMGWTCEGAATFTVHYLVYTGTTPP